MGLFTRLKREYMNETCFERIAILINSLTKFTLILYLFKDIASSNRNFIAVSTAGLPSISSLLSSVFPRFRNSFYFL